MFSFRIPVSIVFRSLLSAVLLASAAAPASAHGPHHVKHNLLVHGENEVFASHLVYKVPHNYQVHLKLRFDGVTRAKYLAAKRALPENLIFFLLDPIEISTLKETPQELQGTLLTEDPNGNRSEIVGGVRMAPADYQVLYLEEVPTDLSSPSPRRGE